MVKALLFPTYILLALLLLTPTMAVQAQAFKIALETGESGDEVISNWKSVSDKMDFIKEVSETDYETCLESIDDLEGRLKQIKLQYEATGKSVEVYQNPSAPSARPYSEIAIEQLDALFELVDPLWNEMLTLANEDIIGRFGYHQYNKD
jgi:hypothetical protein